MLKKLIQQLQTEVDTAFLYKALADKHQNDPSGQIFTKMAEIEQRHAQKVLQKIRQAKAKVLLPSPSFRAKLQVKLAHYFGFDFILSHLTALEYQISKSTIEKKIASGEKITGLENVHLNIIRNLSSQDSFTLGGGLLSKFEGKHKAVGGNELRAAVLGSIDGLVSNLCLVMGVVGATSGNNQVLIAGCAGLLAGAISMAMGEWLSVQSARELYQRQIEIEAEELENSPEEEMNELIILYQAKGMSDEDAKKLAKQVLSNKETALDALVREELGIDKESLGGSAWSAALTSFFLFSIGAIIPVIPFFFLNETNAVIASILFSVIGLFLFGATITLFTGRSVFFSGFRQIIFGLTAGGITYLIGKWIGSTLLV
ncbi:MAG: VIT1/CCC1 transporter family protein [Proteobacteria bacterium]|nr:VIT1/CCC1 transporter family protein [Pseudomonadota bacterium]